MASKPTYSVYQQMIKDYPTFDNEVNTNASLVPNESGIYFVGSTHFNPLTNETFYLIKAGKSINLANRMKNYTTTNPLMFHIGYEVIDKKTLDLTERFYHYCLSKIATAKMGNCAEWWVVSRETYLRFCANPLALLAEIKSQLEGMDDVFISAMRLETGDLSDVDHDFAHLTGRQKWEKKKQSILID